MSKNTRTEYQALHFVEFFFYTGLIQAPKITILYINNKVLTCFSREGNLEKDERK